MFVRMWLRTWGRSLLLTGQLVTTIAIGMGAATALVSLLVAVGYEPLPYRDPDRLVAVWRRPDVGRDVMAISGPDLVDFRDSTPGVFSSLGGLLVPQMWLFDGRGAIKVRTCYIEASVFADLGLQPVLGREVRQDDEPLNTKGAAAAPAWIGHEFWQTRYGGSASVIGETIGIAQGASGRDSRPVQIAGVLPRGASIPMPFGNDATDIWYLLPRDIGSRPRQAALFFGVGRLSPGLSVAQAEAALDAVAVRLGEQYGFDRRKHAVVRRLVAIAQGPARQTLGLLILAGGLVFLIACVNLAMLMGAEGRLRRREIGIRIALGGSRSRLWREVATEKCVLTVLALGLGLVAAPTLLRVLTWLVPAAGLGPPLAQTPPLNLAILLGFATFTLVAALLWSALLISAADRGGASLTLKRAGGPSPAGPGDSGGGTGRWRLILLSLQAGISICLLSAVVVTVRAYTNRASGELGPAPRRTVLLSVIPRDTVNLTATQVADFNREVRSQVERLPGTQAVVLADLLPPVGFPVPFLKDGDAPDVERETTLPMSVSPGYFRTFGIRVLFGRGFHDMEQNGAEPVAVISLEMAERHWTSPGEAIGSRITLGKNRYNIVGVAADFRGYWYEKPVPTVYVHESQSGNWSGSVIVRTTAPANTVAALAPQTLANMAIPATVSNVSTMWARWRAMRTRPLARMTGMLMLAFLALALCVQGVYAVAAGTAASRGHELAVRAALGASPGRLAWNVTRELSVALLTGAAFGHAAGLALRSLLEQWSGTPVPGQGELSAIAVVLLGLTAAVGCYLPTRAAILANPTDLLRQG